MSMKRPGMKQSAAKQEQTPLEESLFKAAKKPTKLSFLDNFVGETRDAIEAVTQYLATTAGSNVKAVVAELRSRGFTISEDAFRSYIRRLRSKGIDLNESKSD